MKFAIGRAKACLLISVMAHFTMRFLFNQLLYDTTIYCRVLDARRLKPVQKKSSSATLQRDKKGGNFYILLFKKKNFYILH
jgi:hypothetical protein